MADWAGRQLGNYQLTRLLGEGGFAEVYLGEHIHLGTQAAIKVLHTQLGGEDTDKFRTEARTIARLLHPNIVRVLDFGVEGKTPFLVMDFAPNGTLRSQHARGKAVPLSTVVSYVKQVAEALQCAHDEKLIHRDVKPENMLVGRRKEILLSDFGIALVAQSSRYQSTQDMSGTMAYMAPEQIQGKPRPASDQYALGIVVYEWLAGERPFHGSFTEIVAQHIAVPPPPLREKVPSLSQDIERVIMIALEKDPQKRFASIQAFANALEQASMSNAPTVVKLQEKVLEPTIAVQQVTTPITPLPPTQYVENTKPMGTVISTYRGHSKEITSVSWSPNSRYLAIGSNDRTVSVWDVATEKNIATYRGHSGSINVVAWSPDNVHVVTASEDITVQIWNATSEGRRHTIFRDRFDSMRGVAWSSDGKYIASAGYKKTFIWDANTGNKIFTYSGNSSIINAIAWSPDSKWLATASNDKTVSIWNTSTGHKILTYRGHSHWVFDLTWSFDSLYIASASRDRTVRIWNATMGEDIFVYRNHSDIVTGIDWSPDGKYIVSASRDCAVRVWNAITGQDVMVHQHTAPVRTVKWSPDEKYIASGGDDKIVQVWVAPQ